MRFWDWIKWLGKEIEGYKWSIFLLVQIILYFLDGARQISLVGSGVAYGESSFVIACPDFSSFLGMEETTRKRTDDLVSWSEIMHNEIRQNESRTSSWLGSKRTSQQTGWRHWKIWLRNVNVDVRVAIFCSVPEIENYGYTFRDRVFHALILAVF